VRVLAEALEAGNEEVVRQIVGLGDVPGHEFHGNQYTEGQVVRFSGTAADNSVTGDMNVKVLNPHSNAHLVTYSEGKGKRFRQYEGATRHLPLATVQTERGNVFEAHHHTLKVVPDLPFKPRRLEDGNA
jgi:hypothetical protein